MIYETSWWAGKAIESKLAWLARAMPLVAAASKLEPNSQSPHMPALPWGSKMHGTLGVLVGRAAPLKVYKK